MNTFEQASSDGHQMSLAGGRAGSGGPMSGGVRELCKVRSNTSWIMVAWGPLCEQTDTNGNITFPQLC